MPYEHTRDVIHRERDREEKERERLAFILKEEEKKKRQHFSNGQKKIIYVGKRRYLSNEKNYINLMKGNKIKVNGSQVFDVYI